jgi:hypothetical protein
MYAPSIKSAPAKNAITNAAKYSSGELFEITVSPCVKADVNESSRLLAEPIDHNNPKFSSHRLQRNAEDDAAFESGQTSATLTVGIYDQNFFQSTTMGP